MELLFIAVFNVFNMKKHTLALACLLIFALLAFGTALAHTACIWLGPACYSAQMAPPVIVESAQNGTWLAPVGTLLVSTLFVIAGLYALSAARLIFTLPLLNLGIHTLTFLCTVRGLLGIQLWLRMPEKVTLSAGVASIVWFAAA